MHSLGSLVWLLRNTRQPPVSTHPRYRPGRLDSPWTQLMQDKYGHFSVRAHIQQAVMDQPRTNILQVARFKVADRS